MQAPKPTCMIAKTSSNVFHVSQCLIDVLDKHLGKTSMCIYVYIYLYIYLSLPLSLCLSVSLCVSFCIYIYIYIYIYILNPYWKTSFFVQWYRKLSKKFTFSVIITMALCVWCLKDGDMSERWWQSFLHSKFCLD